MLLFCLIFPCYNINFPYLMKCNNWITGKQHLRIAQPTVENKKIKLGSQRNDKNSGKTIQESIELIRLQLEQVGFTNPSAWGKTNSYKDEALSLLKSTKNDFIQNSNDPKQAEDFITNKVLPDIDTLSQSIKGIRQSLL
jgi:hypothetical protein